MPRRSTCIQGENEGLELRYSCLIVTVLLIGLLPVQAASFHYSGPHFTNVTFPYASDDSVSGSFSLLAPLEPNRPASPITPSSFSFSDGIQILQT